MSSNLKLQSPAALTAIGVLVTLGLVLIVVIALLQTGGTKAVSDNAAIIGALVALGGVFTTQLVNSALVDRSTQESRIIETQRAQEVTLRVYVDQINDLMGYRRLRETPPNSTEFYLAQAHTFSVFMSLDGTQKRIPLRLIYDLDLIRKDVPLLHLRGASLDHVNLSGMRLSEASLREADLWRANLAGADFTGSDFTWADLRGADLTQAVLTDTSLAHANLLPYDPRNPAQLSATYIFTGRIVDLRSLEDRTVIRTELNQANLIGADLRDAWLYLASLIEARLAGTDLTNADLRRADLRRADLNGAVLRDAVLNGTDLTNADLTNADFTNADLANADLNGAVLNGAVLRGAVLRDANVTKEQLEQADSLVGTTMPNG